ncbi:hypothetical protein SAMN05444166_3238 [Singulisphaera sp. GP187]|uniref:glucuronyl esterase domain-containing protein n=1 Tax=Singulisphaera sp. GP187 TaxID=1882752 RepID=UPI00092B260E|nr:acetylxylan esterase [Singulisphaera sp. GP187]SIO24900.1 hypothetical protein SAMN05444166_3238 [Singulisphaera sp. GP187]
MAATPIMEARTGARLLVLALLTLLVGDPAAIAGFPEASQLPAQAGLPDPLVMLDGHRVASQEEWVAKRRPELKALFQHYMYGVMPSAPEKIATTVARVDRDYFGGKATKKEVAITFGPSATPEIYLLLVVPNRREGPAPVFLGINFCGNHTVVNDPKVALPSSWMPKSCPGCVDNRATDAGRGSQVNVWSIEDVIDRGYAVATFYSGDVAPDHPDFTDGVIPHYYKPGQSKPGPHDWATVAAWAWGLHRAVDYLITNQDIDKSKISVIGHSRMGKAAIVAAAFDERIALAIPHQAGCGGTAPSRGTVGESVKRINTSFPHWFDAEFKAFNDQPDRLPFDQNGLVALVAPRPVLFTNAVDDTWANPEGQFEVLKGADPVYRFLGVEGLEADQMPETGKLIDSRLGYHIRPGKHSMGKDDWKVFLDYADRQLGKPGVSK